MNKAAQLVEVLTRKELTIGSVESFTGGLFAKILTDVSGASKCYKGSLVTYSKEAKENLLGIDGDFIDKYGMVSSGVSQQMAIKGRKLLNVDICVSFTGNAGPEVCEGEAQVGECFMSIVYNKKIWTYPLKVEAERTAVREVAVGTVIDTILSILG